MSLSTPVQQINSPSPGVELYVKREDLNHPTISGNKFRKLKYNLLAAREAGKATLLTFGGAFSNHIYATAAAGKAYGFKTIGVIRGEEQLPLNATLSFAQSCGMQFHYMDRSTYRKKQEADVIEGLKQKYGSFYLIPEGGTNTLAIKGCTEILSEREKEEFNYFCLAVGTGGTMAGIIRSLQGKEKIIGFSSLKGDFLQDEVNKLFKQYNFQNHPNWIINNDFHFGGYAKVKPQLMEFIHAFESKEGFQLDPIYTGKALYGIYSLIEQGYFPEGSKILFIHTGGLQGRKGFGLD